jgi:hypothetical protein
MSDEDKDGEQSEGPEFNVEDFDEQFDRDNPPIIIPPEVVDDIDNDFNIEIINEE